MGAGEFDEAVLTTAVERKPVLSALADTPHHRKELQDELGLSKTTCHRIVRGSCVTRYCQSYARCPSHTL